MDGSHAAPGSAARENVTAAELFRRVSRSAWRAESAVGGLWAARDARDEAHLEQAQRLVPPLGQEGDDVCAGWLTADERMQVRRLMDDAAGWQQFMDLPLPGASDVGSLAERQLADVAAAQLEDEGSARLSRSVKVELLCRAIDSEFGALEDWMQSATHTGIDGSPVTSFDDDLPASAFAWLSDASEDKEEEDDDDRIEEDDLSDRMQVDSDYQLPKRRRRSRQQLQNEQQQGYHGEYPFATPPMRFSPFPEFALLDEYTIILNHERNVGKLSAQDDGAAVSGGTNKNQNSPFLLNRASESLEASAAESTDDHEDELSSSRPFVGAAQDLLKGIRSSLPTRRPTKKTKAFEEQLDGVEARLAAGNRTFEQFRDDLQDILTDPKLPNRKKYMGMLEEFQVDHGEHASCDRNHTRNSKQAESDQEQEQEHDMEDDEDEGDDEEEKECTPRKRAREAQSGVVEMTENTKHTNAARKKESRGEARSVDDELIDAMRQISVSTSSSASAKWKRGVFAPHATRLLGFLQDLWTASYVTDAFDHSGKGAAKMNALATQCRARPSSDDVVLVKHAVEFWIRNKRSVSRLHTFTDQLALNEYTSIWNPATPEAAFIGSGAPAFYALFRPQTLAEYATVRAQLERPPRTLASMTADAGMFTSAESQGESGSETGRRGFFDSFQSALHNNARSLRNIYAIRAELYGGSAASGSAGKCDFSCDGERYGEDRTSRANEPLVVSLAHAKNPELVFDPSIVSQLVGSGSGTGLDAGSNSKSGMPLLSSERASVLTRGVVSLMLFHGGFELAESRCVSSLCEVLGDVIRRIAATLLLKMEDRKDPHALAFLHPRRRALFDEEVQSDAVLRAIVSAAGFRGGFSSLVQYQLNTIPHHAKALWEIGESLAVTRRKYEKHLAIDQRPAGGGHKLRLSSDHAMGVAVPGEQVCFDSSAPGPDELFDVFRMFGVSQDGSLVLSVLAESLDDVASAGSVQDNNDEKQEIAGALADPAYLMEASALWAQLEARATEVKIWRDHDSPGLECGDLSASNRMEIDAHGSTPAEFRHAHSAEEVTGTRKIDVDSRSQQPKVAHPVV
ncbi:hypothetical protein FVE85_7629 [Porphyridium purpureum]|uniref:Uncharacterized protein n=1 Tax=Porphyridium purpureum TaxID=35688 RepID=A0A5J4ZAP1_PORPP|nr:hypothetical protein FVE85_7629 [Porphyridium purpureum]|eukprot:POR5015..scf295_1